MTTNIMKMKSMVDRSASPLNLFGLNRNDKIKLEVKQLKESYIQTHSNLTGKKLTRRIYNTQRLGIVDDDLWTLDQYYISLVNDVLRSIRNYQPAWVFNTAQLKDVLRFEPDPDFKYDGQDEVIYIWK